ncbi:MAG: serine/threonine protein kinase [Candidatus Margulisbacteria bacterium]|jgi:serine/threonine-protein kinase|nr:serine/threonine protein kinase [Candidatus Margulisiibacteriota bacterium]
MPAEIKFAGRVARPYRPIVPNALVRGQSGQYRILREFVSQGGMSKLYEVQSPADGRALLLKQLMDCSAHPLELRQELATRFLRETMVLRQLAPLNDPRFVKLIDYDPDPAPDFYVMEKVPEAVPLSVAIANWGYLTPDLSLKIMSRVVGALYKLSTLSLFRSQPLGFSHRDIKPDNILFSVVNKSIKRVVLIDLGIIRLPYSMLTALGSFRGTPGYCAPETIGSSASADQRSDVFSLGCVLHYLLLGRDAFDYSQSPDWQDRFYAFPRTVAADVKKLAAARPSHIPADVWSFMIKSLAPEPAARFASYADLYSGLCQAAWSSYQLPLPALG